MKNFYPIQLFAGLLLVSLSLPCKGFANSINGTWVNVDTTTRGLTKVVISDNSKLHLWAACSGTICDLGEVEIWNGGEYFKALFKQRIAKRKMKIFSTGQSTLRIIVRTEYNDDRANRTDYFSFNKVFSFEKEDGSPLIKLGDKKEEDCMKIEHATAKVNIKKDNYILGFGSPGFTPFFGFGNKKEYSLLALNVIKEYEIEKSCSVGSMQYLLTDRGAPRGKLDGEDCVGFELNKLKVIKQNGRYKITSQNVVLFDFGKNKEAAIKALKRIKKYGFRNLCYISRRSPVFMYFRR